MKTGSLDAKQKLLAKRLIEFRKKLLEDVENKKPDRQLLTSMKGVDNALNLLRATARTLRKHDYRMFTDVIDVIKSLQGDLTNKI